MKAIQVVAVGAPLELCDIPIPEPGAGQVVIKQNYSSINPLDWKVQNAITAGNLPLPVTIGWDIAGTVHAIGKGVTKFSVGDSVFGFTNKEGQALAEYVLVNIEHIVLRKNLPKSIAGVTPVVFTTAWVPLYVQDDLSKRKGQSIYVAGGSGGVGHIAIQLAKYEGLTVIASASKPDGLKLCSDCGADHVINYRTQDVAAEVLKLTNNRGVDIVLDTTYNERSFVQSAKAVAKGGRWYRIGNTLNQIANADEAVAICKQKGVECDAGDLRRYWVEPYVKDVALLTESLERADQLYKHGVTAKIYKTIPFQYQEVAKAVEESGHGKHLSKVSVKF
jgi:NADPH:quinone reductase-like Zn-dependent oxidoreductase